MGAAIETSPVLIVSPRPAQRWMTFVVATALLVPACFLPSVLLAERAYTSSLLVFAVPSAVLTVVLKRAGARAATWRALAKAWVVLVPMGIVLMACSSSG